MFGRGILKGLSVTIRHFWNSYVYDRLPWEDRYSREWLEKHQAIGGKGLFTIQYPEQKRELPEHFRNLPMLIYDEKKEEPRCVACGICARVCPPQCIWIERGTDDRGRPKPKPARFWVDATVCMSCGYCAEYCPFDAIKMDQEYEILVFDRERELILDMDRLLKPVDYHARLHPTDFAREQAAREAKQKG
jgi:NADH-quinone oxidoreductase subunit I